MKQFLKQPISFFLIGAILFYMYVKVSKFWSTYGGSFNTEYFKFEIPLFFILAFLFYFPLNQKRWLSYLYAYLPLLGLYVLFDIFYFFLRKSPRVSDLQNFSTMFDFAPLFALSGLLFFVIIFLPIIISFIKWFQYTSKREVWKILSVKSSLILLLFFLFMSDKVYSYQNETLKFQVWAGEKNIRKNGRLTNFLFYHYKKEKALVQLKNKTFENLNVHEVLYPGSLSKKPNVHIIILESWLDPRLIHNTIFDTSPLFEGLKSFLGTSGEFSYPISGIYGGGTAQSEFEILTGIKAFAHVESIEFNTLEGFPVQSFITKLTHEGYTSTAMIGTDDKFFNSKTAYKSLGFEQTFFLENETNFPKNKLDKRIFDGDIYTYNIDFLKNYIANQKKPIVNYILTMYGHTPYSRNLEERPDIITSAHTDARIQRITNQFYYRTKALSEYLATLQNIDPESIILVISDHIPPVLDHGVTYKKNPYENIGLLLFNKQSINLDKKHYYEIPILIWKLLQNESNTAIPEINEQRMMSLYYNILSEGMGIK